MPTPLYVCHHIFHLYILLSYQSRRKKEEHMNICQTVNKSQQKQTKNQQTKLNKQTNKQTSYQNQDNNLLQD